MKCSKCGYIYNGVENISNCPKCGQSYGNVDEEGLSNKSKAAVALGAAAGAVAGLANLASQDKSIFASENKAKNYANSGSDSELSSEIADANNETGDVSTNNSSNVLSDTGGEIDSSTGSNGGLSSGGDSLNIDDVTGTGGGTTNLGDSDTNDISNPGDKKGGNGNHGSDSDTNDIGNPDENTGGNDNQGSDSDTNDVGNPDENTGGNDNQGSDSDTNDVGNPDENTGGSDNQGSDSDTNDVGNPDENTGGNDNQGSDSDTNDVGNPDENTGGNDNQGSDSDTNDVGDPDEETGGNDNQGSDSDTNDVGNPDENTGGNDNQGSDSDTNDVGDPDEETGGNDNQGSDSDTNDVSNSDEETGGNDNQGSDSNTDDRGTSDDTSSADTQQQSSGGGGGIGDIDFGPSDLDSVLGFFDLGHAYNTGTTEFGLINESGENIASKVKTAMENVSALKCMKDASINAGGAYNTLMGAIGSNGSGGYLAELKGKLQNLYNIYTRMCGGVDAYNAYVDLDIKAKIEQAHNSAEKTDFENSMRLRGIDLDDLAVSTINNLNDYFDAELERLKSSDKELTKAELEDTFLYKITDGSLDFDTRQELIQGYIDQIYSLCLTLNFLGNASTTDAALIDLNEKRTNSGITFDEYVYNNVMDGIDIPYWTGEGDIPDGSEGDYKSETQMQLEKAYYSTCTSINYEDRSDFEKLLVDAINNHIESYASKYYFDNEGSPIPADSHVYQLAKIGVVNEAFRDGLYVNIEDRSESAQKIIDLWNQPWITGSSSSERVGRDVFEETFFLTQLNYDNYGPAYDKAMQEYESMYQLVTDENGKSHYEIKINAAESYFLNNYSETELIEIFGADNYPYVISSGCRVLSVSDEELVSAFLQNCNGSKSFVDAYPNYFNVDEKGNVTLKPDVSADTVIGSFITQQYEDAATRMFNLGDQMRLLNTLTPYMSSNVEAQRKQYEDLYNQTWDQYNEAKAQFDEEHAKWEANPEKYGEEPKFDALEPNLAEPNILYPMTSDQTKEADNLYLTFANGLGNDYLTTNPPITDYLPDCSAYDGFEPPVDLWEPGQFSDDMLKVLSYTPVDASKLPNADPNANYTIDVDAIYTAFCDDTVNGLINANKTKNYINSKFNAALSYDLADLDVKIAEEQKVHDENYRQYMSIIGSLGYGNSIQEIEEAKERAQPYLEAMQESQARLDSLNGARDAMDLTIAQYQDTIDSLSDQLNLLVPRLSTFDANALRLTNPDNISSYVADYVEYYDGQPVVVGKQLNQETLSDISEEVKTTIEAEIESGDLTFATDADKEAYIKDQTAYRQAMYIMELQNSGVYINLASVSPMVKSYVEAFGYIKQNQGEAVYTNTIYCMEYTRETMGLFEFSDMFNNTYTSAFNFEAERRAQEYLNSWAKDLKDQWDDNGMNVLEWIGYGLAEAAEHTWEDVLVPMGNGLAGSIKGIGKAFENLFEDISGQEINPINLVSINDAMWDNIYRIGAQTGQLTQLQTYVMQASNSVGNMAIPMVLGLCGLGALSTAWMAVSAFGNTIEECKKEIANGSSNMSLISAYAYSVLSAASEVVMEKALGALPGIGKAASTGFKGVINSALDEAKEEVIQTFVDPALKDMVMGIEAGIKWLNGDKTAFQNVDWAVDDLKAQDFVDAAIVAMISSGMTSSTKIVTSTVSLFKYGNSSLIEISNMRESTLISQGMTEAQAKAMVKTELSQIATNSAAFNAQLEAALNNPDVKAAYEAQQQLFDEAQKANKKFNDPKAEMSFTDFALDMVYSQTVTGGIDVSSTINAYDTILKSNLSEIAKLEGELKTLQESLTKADADGKAKIEAKIENVQNSIDAVKSKLPALQQAYTQAIETQKESLTFYENTYDNLIKEVSELTDKKNELESKSELTDEEQKSLNEINDKIQNIYDNKLPALEEVINNTRAEVENRIEQTQNAINGLEQIQHDLRVEMETADINRVNDIKQELKTNQEMITDLTVQMKADQISLNIQNEVQLENKINNLQDLISKNDGSNNNALTLQLEHTQKQLADTLVNEKNWLNRNNETLTNEKLSFREGATTGSIDQLIADNQTRIEQIDQKLDTLREAGVEVNDGNNKVEIGQNVTTTIDTKQTALTYLTATIGGGASTIGGVTTIIDNKIDGLRGQLTNLQKQGNKNNNGSKNDPEIRKKKAELKQQINEHKQVKQELLKSMHEYGMNNNSPITDFMDALQLDLDGLHDVGGKFVDSSFKKELDHVKIEGLTSQASKQVQSLTISVNEFISYMNRFRAVDKSNPQVLQKFNSDVSAFFTRAKTVTASLAAKIPNIFDMSTKFDAFGEKLQLLRSFPTNTKNDLLNQYNGLQLEIRDVVNQLGRGKPVLDATAIADINTRFETFKTKFNEEVAKIVDLNVENVENVLGKPEVDSIQEFNKLFDSITDVLGKLDEFSAMSDMVSNINIVSSQLTDLFDLTKTQTELEALFAKQSTTDEIIEKLSELKNNIVKYSKQAFKSKVNFEVVADANSIDTSNKLNIVSRVSESVQNLLDKISNLVKNNITDPADKIRTSGAIQYVTTEVIDFTSGVFTSISNFSKLKLDSLVGKIKALADNMKHYKPDVELVSETVNSLMENGDIKLIVEAINVDSKVLGSLLENGYVDFLMDPNVPTEILTNAAQYIRSNKLDIKIATNTDVDATIRLLVNGLNVNFDPSIRNDLCSKLADMIEPLDIVDANTQNIAARAFIPLFKEISTNPDSLSLTTDIINKLSDAHSAMLAEMLDGQKYISYTDLSNLLRNCSVESIRNILPALSMDTKKVLFNKSLVDFSNRVGGGMGYYELMYDCGVEIIEYIKTISDNKLKLAKLLKEITVDYATVKDMKKANDIIKAIAKDIGSAKRTLYSYFGQDLIGGKGQYINGVNFYTYAADSNNIDRVNAVVNEFLQAFSNPAIPPAVKACLTSASFYDVKNPDDYYWSLEYGVDGWKDIRSNFVSAATGGYGTYTSWDLTGGDLGTISHELGHSVDTTLYRLFYGDQVIEGSDGYFSKVPNSSWQQAIAADGNSISDYGNNSPSEDLAESLKAYVTDRVNFEKNFPNRAAELNRLLVEVANSKINFDFITDMVILRTSMVYVGKISDATIDNWLNQGYTFDQLKSAYVSYMTYGGDIDSILSGLNKTSTEVQQVVDVVSNIDIALNAINNGDMQVVVDLVNQDFSVVTSLIDAGNYSFLQEITIDENVLTQAFDYMAQNNKLPDISTFDITTKSGLSFLYLAYENALGDKITDILPQLAARVVDVMSDVNVDASVKTSVLNVVFNMNFDSVLGDVISQMDRNVAANLVTELINYNPGVANGALNVNPDLFNNIAVTSALLEKGITSFLTDGSVSSDVITNTIDYLATNGKLSLLGGVSINVNTDIDLAIDLLSKGFNVTYDNSVKYQLFNQVIDIVKSADTLSIGTKMAAIRTFAPVLNVPNSAMAIEIVESISNTHPELLAEIFEGSRYVTFDKTAELLSNCSIESIRYVLSCLSISSKFGLFKQTLGTQFTNKIGYYELKADTGFDTIREIISVYDDADTRNRIVSYIISDYNTVKGMTNLNDILKQVAHDVGTAKLILYRNGQDLIRTEDLNGIPIKVYAADTSEINVDRLNSIVQTFRQSFNDTSIPKVAKMCLEVASFYDVTNPQDYYWSIQYGVRGWKDIRSGFRSAATGGHGTYTSWNFAGSSVSTVAHELGHSLDTTLYKMFYGDRIIEGTNGYFSKTPNSSWQQAINADGKPVSEYGKNSYSEDLADSLRAFVTDRVNFENNFPNRAAELKKLLKMVTETKLDIVNVTDMQTLRDLMIKHDISSTDIDMWLDQGFTESQIKDAFIDHIAFGDDMSSMLKVEVNQLEVVNNQDVVDNNQDVIDGSSFFKQAADIVAIEDVKIVNPVISQVNQMIATNGFASIDLNTAAQMSVADLQQISDLSKVEFYVSNYFSDMNGQTKAKYLRNDKYRRRHTYTGYELLSINAKLEQLQSRIDMSQPISVRARQIYDLLVSELPIMHDYQSSAIHLEISQSLRGLTANNAVGKPGLVCAGFASVFKELCDRTGVPCDYIRGKAVLDPLTGRGGGHAWNVVVAENGQIIPVDATWHGDTWFGKSQKFAETHIADADEVYRDYFGDESQSTRMIDHIVQTMDAKKGAGKGLYALTRYLETGDTTFITRTDGARDLLKQLTFDDITEYLKTHSSVSNKYTSDLNSVFDSLVSRFGNKEQAIIQLREYVFSGDLKYITSQGGARDIIQRIPMNSVKEYLNQHLSNPSIDISPSMLVEVDVNPDIIDEALRINEPPQVQNPSTGLEFSGNQSIESLNLQHSLESAIVAFRNALGLIDIGEAEANGLVTVDRDPLKAKDGAREKNWVEGPKDQNGNAAKFLFKKTLGINYESFGEILGYEFANLIKLDCAKYDLATLDGADGVISYNIKAEGEELISGKDILTTVEQFYINPMLSLISRYNSIMSEFNLDEAKLKDKKAVISELITLYNSTFARSEGFTKFVDSIKVEKITSKNFDKVFDKFKDYFDTISETYEYSFSDWNNKKKVVKGNNLYDIWTLLDKYCDLHGYTIADGHNVMRDLVKMTVYDLILYQGDRHISNWSILRDKKTNTIRFAPIYDNSNICNLNEGKDRIAQKVSSILAFEKNKDRLTGAKLERTLEILNRQVTGNDSKIMVEYDDNAVKGNNIDMLRKLIETSDQDTVDMIREICNEFSSENITAVFDKIEADYNIKLPNDVKVLVSKTIEVNMEKINELFDDHGDSDNSSPSSSNFNEDAPSMMDEPSMMDAPILENLNSDLDFTGKSGLDIYTAISTYTKEDIVKLIENGTFNRSTFDKLIEFLEDENALLSQAVDSKAVSTLINNTLRAYSSYIDTVSGEDVLALTQDLKYVYYKTLSSISSAGIEYRIMLDNLTLRFDKMDFTGTYFVKIFDCVSQPDLAGQKLIASLDDAKKQIDDTILGVLSNNFDTYFSDSNLMNKYPLNCVSTETMVEYLKTLSFDQLCSLLKHYRLSMFNMNNQNFILSLTADQRYKLFTDKLITLPLYGTEYFVGDFSVDQKLYLINNNFVSPRIFDLSDLYSNLSLRQLIDLACIDKFDHYVFIENIKAGVYTSEDIIKFMELYSLAFFAGSINSFFDPSYVLSTIFDGAIKSETKAGNEVLEYAKDLIRKMYEDTSIDDSRVTSSFLGLIQGKNINASEHYEHLSERNQILYLNSQHIANVEESFVSKTPVYVHDIDGCKIDFYACDAEHAKLYAMKLEHVISRIPEGNFKKLLLQTEICVYGVSDFGNYAAGIRYNIDDFVSAASAYAGHIDLYLEGINESEIDVLGTLCHENGHVVDNAILAGKWTSNDSVWGELTAFEKSLYSGKAVTKYGETFYSEDFADSFKLYFRDPALFRQMYPIRALQLENILNAINEDGSVGTFDIVVPKVETVEGGYKILTDETSGKILGYLMFDVYNRNITLEVSKAIELFLDDDIDITKYFTEKQIADYNAGNFEAVNNSLWDDNNGEITEDIVESNDNDDSNDSDDFDGPSDSPSSSIDTIEPPSIVEDETKLLVSLKNLFEEDIKLTEVIDLKDKFISGDDTAIIDAILQKARLGKNGDLNYANIFGTVFTGVTDEASLKNYLINLFNSANRMTELNKIQFKAQLFEVICNHLNNPRSIYSAANAFEDITSIYFNYMLLPYFNMSNSDASLIKILNEEIRQKLVSSNIQIQVEGVNKRAYSILDFTDENVSTLQTLLKDVRREKIFGETGLIKNQFFINLLGGVSVDSVLETSILDKIDILHFDPFMQKQSLAISILEVIYGFSKSDSKLIYNNILSLNLLDNMVKPDGSKVTINDIKELGYDEFFKKYIEAPKIAEIDKIVSSFDGLVDFDALDVREYILSKTNMQSSDAIIKELVYDYFFSKGLMTPELSKKIISDLTVQFTLADGSYFNGKTIRFKSTNKIHEFVFDTNNIRIKNNLVIDLSDCTSYGDAYMKFISSSLEVKLTDEFKTLFGTDSDYITLDEIEKYGYDKLEGIRYVQRNLCSYIYINLDKAGFTYDSSGAALLDGDVYDQSKCYFVKGNLKINYESLEHILMYNEGKSASGGHYNSLFLHPYSIKNDVSGEVVDLLDGYIYKDGGFLLKDGGRVKKTIWPSSVSINRIFDVADYVFNKGVVDNHLVRVIAKGKPDSNMMYYELVDTDNSLVHEIELIFGESIDKLVTKLYSCVTSDGLLVTFYPVVIGGKR